MKLFVFRLGHRPERDKRISTHVFLAARAFLCSSGFYSGSKDKELEESIKKVVKNWGGDFKIKYEGNWKKFIKNFPGIKIHLTMYGIPFQEKINEIRKNKENKLIIVGGEKVPGEVYEMADYNIAVTNQPHSEVSALAVFLHEFWQGKELKKDFKGKLKIIPQEKGKKITNNNY